MVLTMVTFGKSSTNDGQVCGEKQLLGYSCMPHRFVPCTSRLFACKLPFESNMHEEFGWLASIYIMDVS
jgi:hypothetical protein